MTHRLNVVSVDNDQPWYQKGLRFQCTECGKCCTGTPGYTWVNEQEIEAIAEFLKLPLKTFYQRYLRNVDNRWALLEDSKNYDCIFLKDKKCQIYSTRPKQCRTFPWWPKLLQSENEWEEAAKYCEGICPAAPFVGIKTIQENLKQQMHP